MLLLAGIASGCVGSVATTDSNGPAADMHDRTAVAEAAPAYRLRRAAEPALAAPPAPGLAMRGRGAAGRIVDAAGNVVWEGSEATPLYGLQVSPDGRRALLYFGDATYSVRPVDALADAGTALPPRPARAGATAFGAWHWLDGDRLLGIAAIPGAADAAATAAEIESQSPDAMVLSVFDLRDGSLGAVGIASDLPRVFSVVEVHGNDLHLQVEGQAAPVWARIGADGGD